MKIQHTCNIMTKFVTLENNYEYNMRSCLILNQLKLTSSYNVEIMLKKIMIYSSNQLIKKINMFDLQS